MRLVTRVRRREEGDVRVVAGLTVAVGVLLAGCTTDGAGAGPGAASPAPSSSSAAAPTGSPPSTSAADPEPPPPPPPPEAACYRIGVRSASRTTNSSRPVSCRGPHTAQTIRVGRLDLSPAGRRLRIDAPAVQRQPAQVCPAQLRRYVGGTTDVRRRSRFEVVWFTPTLEQAARGARWFRCDTVAVLEDGRLQQLPRGARLRGVLDDPSALATYGLCGTARPGTRGFDRVACALRHSWEAISTIDLAGGARYPGVARVRTAGDDDCAAQVKERSGTVLQFSYGWEWPTRAQWAAGQHYGYCWAPD